MYNYNDSRDTIHSINCKSCISLTLLNEANQHTGNETESSDRSVLEPIDYKGKTRVIYLLSSDCQTVLCH